MELILSKGASEMKYEIQVLFNGEWWTFQTTNVFAIAAYLRDSISPENMTRIVENQ